MAHEKFQVEVLTPEGSVYEGEAEMVSTRTSVGSIGLLAHHEPVLAMLDPTELRIYESENDVVRFAQAEGYLQVAGNRAMLLVEEAYRPEDLDSGSLRERLERAEQELSDAGDDTEKQRVAQRDRRRLEQFLKIAESA